MKKPVIFRFECSICGLHTFTDNYNEAEYHGEDKCGQGNILNNLEKMREWKKKNG